MAAEKEDRCAEAKKFQLIEDAFRRGDLEGLRAALDDPNLVPHGRMPDAVGSCLVYAIYHSPQPFIRKLLEIGADPNTHGGLTFFAREIGIGGGQAEQNQG